MEYVHRRVLNINFRLIEKDLRYIANLLNLYTSDRNFILYSVNNDVDSDMKDRISNISNRILEELEKIQKQFQLESEEDLNVKRRVLSNLNEIWSPLKDLTSGRMHGYEYLSNSDKHFLDLHTSKLFTIIENIYNLLK